MGKCDEAFALRGAIAAEQSARSRSNTSPAWGRTSESNRRLLSRRETDPAAHGDLPTRAMRHSACCAHADENCWLSLQFPPYMSRAEDSAHRVWRFLPANRYGLP